MSQGYTACPLISAIDVTGVRATQNFNYKGRTIYKTAIGGLASGIAFIIILVTSVLMS